MASHPWPPSDITSLLTHSPLCNTYLHQQHFCHSRARHAPTSPPLCTLCSPLLSGTMSLFAQADSSGGGAPLFQMKAGKLSTRTVDGGPKLMITAGAAHHPVPHPPREQRAPKRAHQYPRAKGVSAVVNSPQSLTHRPFTLPQLSDPRAFQLRTPDKRRGMLMLTKEADGTFRPKNMKSPPYRLLSPLCVSSTSYQWQLQHVCSLSLCALFDLMYLCHRLLAYLSPLFLFFSLSHTL